MKHALIGLVLAAAGCAERAIAQQPPAKASPAAAPVVLSDAQFLYDPIVYRVKMTTTVAVPAAPAVDQVRVWHALPTLRPWSASGEKYGAFDVRSSAGGAHRFEAAHDSHHMFWQIDGRLRAGGRYTFTTEFSVRSGRREFVPEKADVKWAAYAQPPRNRDERVDPGLAAAVEPLIAGFADKVKATLPPPQAVREFADWVKKTIVYDASVAYAPADVAATLRNSRGHCAHQYAVLEQLCRRAGIPIRPVFGLNLYQRDGTGDLSRVRADYTNIHTWAEVFFPGFGWVELNPEQGAEAFNVPARLIQNDKWFQNYAVWIRAGGVQRLPTWTYQGGRWVSECGLENLITYSEEKR